MNLNYLWENKKSQASFAISQSRFQSIHFNNSHLSLFLFFSLLLFFASPVCNSPAWAEGSNTQSQQRNPAWAKPLEASGMENFYQVNNWLYRSAQPDAEGFKNIEAMGIKTVINLRESNKDPKAAVGTKLILLNAPITTWSFNDNDIASALQAVTQAQRPVLVHCRHGADRTGLIIALIRVLDEGWSVEDAKQEMLEGGYGFHAIWKNIPKYLDDVDIDALKAKI